MNNPIKQIFQFNREAGFLNGEYSDVRESAYSIEEMLEGAHEIYLESIYKALDSVLSNGDMQPVEGGKTPKGISRQLVNLAGFWIPQNHLSDVDRFDKHIDSIVFNFGSLFKLGLTPQQAMHGLQVVMDANMAKLKNKQVDANGKLMKPTDFVNPEPELQKILDKRN